MKIQTSKHDTVVMEQAWKMQKNSLYCNARLRNKKEKMKRKKKVAVM